MCHNACVCAARVCEHVGPDSLLVGHTLDNDLKALRIVHGERAGTGQDIDWP